MEVQGQNDRAAFDLIEVGGQSVDYALRAVVLLPQHRVRPPNTLNPFEGGHEMLRGLSTMNVWAEDLEAATRWYTELLGVEPYFTSEAVGRGPGYVEFR